MAGKKNFFKPIVEENVLVAFNVSVTVYPDACTFVDGNAYPPYFITFYHNGAGATPTIGDTVYTDAEGTTVTPPNGYYVEATLTKLSIGAGGVVVDPGCR